MTDVERTTAGRGTVSRRTFLRATAIGGLLATATPTAADGPTNYQFGGEVPGWSGQKPDAIEGETNPTLRLVAGTTYTISWVNLDGQQHQLQIRTADGTTVASTDLVSRTGATGSLSFTATPEVTGYRCSIHPSSMSGEIQVGRRGGATATRRANAEPGTRSTIGGPSGSATATASTAIAEVAGGSTTPETTAKGIRDGGASRGQPGFGIETAVAGVAGLAGLLGLARRR